MARLSKNPFGGCLSFLSGNNLVINVGITLRNVHRFLIFFSLFFVLEEDLSAKVVFHNLAT